MVFRHDHHKMLPAFWLTFASVHQLQIVFQRTVVFTKFLCRFFVALLLYGQLITGPPTHSVGGPD